MPDNVKERGIIFNTDMVKAILSGAKTQTRRLIKGDIAPCPNSDCGNSGGYGEEYSYGDLEHIQCEWCWTKENSVFNLKSKCPYGKLGDRVWVQETWRHLAGHVYYRASDESASLDEKVRLTASLEVAKIEACAFHGIDKKRMDAACAWRPSIHMPRWASRITLEIIDVRVERVQDISWKDAVAEGVKLCFPVLAPELAVQKFKKLWDSIYGKGEFAWNENPWCWVIDFKKLEGE